MQFALQALPFSRHAQNDMLFGHLATAPGVARAPRSAAQRPAARLRPPAAPNGVRILRSQSQDGQGGRLLISGRMADVCAALNRMAFSEYACG